MFDWNQQSAARALAWFEQLCAIPHPSRHTKAISDFCVQFAKDRGLWWKQDGANNVIIKKPASPGMENCPAVMIQGHLDMVPAKEDGKVFDFTKDPLELKLEGDWLSATGTTLGADDCIAVAYCLAILEAEDLKHPPLICVFTTDEEIGMLGAQVLDLSGLEAAVMLNLDMEQEGKVLLGCAGGGCAKLRLPLARTLETAQEAALRLKLTGLKGGHSGVEINCGWANGIRVMSAILQAAFAAFPEAGLAELAGGMADNAIPSSCSALLSVPQEKKDSLEAFLAGDACAAILAPVREKEPEAVLEVTAAEAPEAAAKAADVLPVLESILALPNGVQAMSKEVPGLVETSLNAGVLAFEEELTLQVSVRSSVDADRDRLLDLLVSRAEAAGGSAELSGIYPGWPPKAHSKLVELARRLWEEQTGTALGTEAVHAGLECGIFSRAFPEMDILSYGPEILDIHTPRERLSVSSTNRIWDFTVRMLENLTE